MHDKCCDLETAKELLGKKDAEIVALTKKRDRMKEALEAVQKFDQTIYTNATHEFREGDLKEMRNKVKAALDAAQGEKEGSFCFICKKSTVHDEVHVHKE